MKNVSPHVQIYKFPLTAITSITNRITGLGITGMYIGLGTSYLFNQNLLDYYDKTNQRNSVIEIYYSYGR